MEEQLIEIRKERENLLANLVEAEYGFISNKIHLNDLLFVF